MKLSKKYKYIIYKLSDDYKEIVVDEASADKDWDNFREKLINATAKSKSVSWIVCSGIVQASVLMSFNRALLARVPAMPSTTSSTPSPLVTASGMS